jgi:hypothetical protein
MPRDRLDLLGRHAHQPGHARLQYAHTAAADRAHRIFLLSGQAQLTYEKNIEFDPEPLCDSEPKWHTAARQGQYDRIGAPVIGPQRQGQQFAGLGAVLEAAKFPHVRRSPAYWMVSRRAAAPCRFGSVSIRMPFSSRASAAASSTSDGNVKLRWYLRVERSEYTTCSPSRCSFAC